MRDAEAGGDVDVAVFVDSVVDVDGFGPRAVFLLWDDGAVGEEEVLRGGAIKVAHGSKSLVQ